ncbi:MAG: hypothetical protein C4526_02600 [Nitrospiraceae bacterium]|nr:MAG: hypothetical protein C4526_02600 [Nitrospiraceae bacterium]
MNDKVVITGFGLVSSLGLTASETWESLLSGQSGIRPAEGTDMQGFNCKAAAPVNGLDPSGLGIHPRDARIMDKHSHMLMKCGQDAYKHAKLDTASIPAEETGFYAGMGMIDYNISDLLPAVLKSLDTRNNLDYDAFYSRAYQEIHPLWPLSMLNNISFCQVAINLGLKGENTVFSPHADSGAQAIIEGVNSIIEKKAQAVLAGGVSEKISPMSLARSSWFGGTVPGEGCGIIALELLSSAKNRQTSCFAAITGYACAFEKSGGPHGPSSTAVSNAMDQAISRAGLRPSDIDLIIAHGDGTHAGDKNEIEAINNTFSDCLDKVNVFTSKGALGHLLAAAPAVDIILGIYMLRDGIIPAVCNASPVDKDIRFKVACNVPVKKDLKRILINACSYEGQCASLIIEKVV